MERLLTAADVVAITRYARRRVYQAIQTGELAAIRYGRSIRIRPEDLDAWLAAMRTGGQAQGTGA